MVCADCLSIFLYDLFSWLTLDTLKRKYCHFDQTVGIDCTGSYTMSSMWRQCIIMGERVSSGSLWHSVSADIVCGVHDRRSPFFRTLCPFLWFDALFRTHSRASHCPSKKQWIECMHRCVGCPAQNMEMLVQWALSISHHPFINSYQAELF